MKEEIGRVLVEKIENGKKSDSDKELTVSAATIETTMKEATALIQPTVEYEIAHGIDNLFYEKDIAESVLTTIEDKVMGLVLHKLDPKTYAKPEMHYVGEFGDGYRCGVFFRKPGTDEVHCRDTWEEQGVDVDRSAFERVIPDGAGAWIPLSEVEKDFTEAESDDPDVEYS